MSAISRPGQTLQTATREVLESLRRLVNGNEVRVDVFSGSDENASNLVDLMNELQQRRRAAMAAELRAIASFFSMREGADLKSADATLLDECLLRLTASFALLKYRDYLRDFRTVVRDLHLLGNRSDEVSNSLDIPGLFENFRLCDAPHILATVKLALGGLTPSELLLVGRLPDATLLLSFLRMYGSTLESSGSLDRAQNRAVSDDHAMSILLKLLPLRNLLRPFYESTLRSLSAMKSHLDTFVSSPGDLDVGGDRDSKLIAVAELTNVSENWSLVQLYFRDGADSDSGAEVVEQLVELYLKSGQYVSSFTSHPGGASKSFTYSTARDENGDRKTLPAALLREQVQAAVLILGSNTDSQISSGS